MENAQIKKFKYDILSSFQTLWAFLFGIRLIMVCFCVYFDALHLAEDGKTSTLSLLHVMFALKRCIKLQQNIVVVGLGL